MTDSAAARATFVLGFAVAAMAIAGCAPAVKPTPPPVVLATAAAAVDPADCPPGQIEGTLILNFATGLGIRDGSGANISVIWPFGYSAYASIGGANFLDPNGRLLARPGENVRLVGGAMGLDGTWRACGTVERRP